MTESARGCSLENDRPILRRLSDRSFFGFEGNQFPGHAAGAEIFLLQSGDLSSAGFLRIPRESGLRDGRGWDMCAWKAVNGIKCNRV